MAIADDFKRVSQAGKERATAAWASLRGQPAVTPTAPPVPETTYTRPGPTMSMGAATGPAVPPAAPNLALETPQQAASRVAGLGGSPAAPANPGFMARANADLTGATKLGRFARGAGGAVGAVVEGAQTMRDVATPGMTGLDKAARVAEGAGRLAATTSGAALGATAGSVVPIIGTTIGGVVGGTAGYFAPDAVNWAAKKLGLVDEGNQLASAKAADLRAQTTRPGAVQTSAPQTASSTQAAPKNLATGPGQASAAPSRPREEIFAPGSVEARGISRQVADRSYIPENGGGVIVRGDGRVTRLNPEQPKAATTEAGDFVEQQLQKDALSAGNGRARRQAAIALGNYQNQKAEIGMRGEAAKLAAGKTAASNDLEERKLADARVKDFRTQAIDNQFSLEDGKPDQNRNNQFANFVRKNGPALVQGLDPNNPIGSISQLEGQSRDNVMAQLRAEFLKNELTNKSLNSQWFGNPGETNKMIGLRNVRPSQLSDIGEGGVGFRPLYDWLPLVNDNVVETDAGLIPAEDLIGTGEGSYDRREQLVKRGMR